MKGTASRLLTFVLCMALLVGLLPFGAAAQEENLELSVTSVNPRYADAVTEDDLLTIEDIPVFFSDETVYFSTLDEMAAYLRDAMEQRAPLVRMGLQADSTDLFTEENIDYVINTATAHTGVPTEGDYLAWQYEGYSCDAAASWNGTSWSMVFPYVLTYYTTAEQEETVTAEVEAVLASLDLDEKSDYAKLRAVYDYITQNVTYDYDNLDDETYKLKHTAYAALIDKTAVCQGYALLLYRFALELGIDCRFISGTGNGGPHGWNILRIGDVYYNADATWDAGKTEYDYFLVCDDNFTDHTRDNEYEAADFCEAYPMGETDYTLAVIAQGACGDNLTWVLDSEGLLTISGTGPMDDFKNYGPWYSYAEQITAVKIESGVTSIGETAFTSCSSVQSVTISETVTSIPEESVFVGCAVLKEIRVHGENPNYSSDSYGFLFNKDQTLLIRCPQGFEGAYDIPTTVTQMSETAFQWCESITGITVPSGVTKLGTGAFMGCSALKDVILSEGLEIIGQEAFAYCEMLETIQIPSTVTTVGSGAFDWCSALTEIRFIGDAPEFSEYIFALVTANAYYPGNNETWTADVMQNYGGTLRWIPYGLCDSGHSFGEWETTKDATCTADGEKRRDCANCDHYETAVISAAGHRYGDWKTVEAATCTGKGSEKRTCVCGEVETRKTDALGHRYGEWKTAEAATCTEKGSEKRTCVCGEVETRETDALGHKYEDGICTVCGEADPDYAVGVSVIRIAGTSRSRTAYKAADELKEVLGIEKFDTIILASGDNFADALAGSYLAAVKKAPILLYRPNALNENADYITRNLADDGKVYILGGTASVSQEMEDTLTNSGIRVERLAGSNRYNTNLAILKEAGINGDEILVSTGLNFADSLSASATGKPILLVNSNSNKLTDAQITFLKEVKGAKLTIIGGTSSVSQELAEALSAYGTVERVSGPSREKTSVAVAERYFPDADCAMVAYSRNYPDGLCGGPLAYVLGAPLLLTDAGREAPAQVFVEAKGITRGIALGGPASVKDSSVRIVFAMAETDEIISK